MKDVGKRCLGGGATFTRSQLHRIETVEQKWSVSSKLAMLGDPHLVYLHEFGVFLRPLDGHLDDVGRRRHGGGRVMQHPLPDLCLSGSLPTSWALSHSNLWKKEKQEG